MSTEQTSNSGESDIEELADMIMVLQRCMMMNLSRELSRGQVSFAQFFLLGHLTTHPAISMSEIADCMNHTTAAATGLVDRLENLGYVERWRGDTDRRKVLVKITQKGLGLVSRVREDIVNNLSNLMNFLPPDERVSWLSIYRKIYDYCQKKNP